MSVENEQNIKEFLAHRTGTSAQDWFLVSKARYGMQVVFTQIQRALGAGEVISQLFTCATAVNPIVVSGLTPVYGSVSASNISLDAEQLPFSQLTRAVVIQNTFGIVDSSNAQRIARSAREAGAIVVEDSAHCIGRMARDESGQPVADVSIHSFGAEKVLPTKFGGAIWVNPQFTSEQATGLRGHMVEALATLPTPSAKTEFAMRTYRSQLRVLSRIPGNIGKSVRNQLARIGIFEPPIVPSETSGQQPQQPAKISRFAASAAHENLKNLDRIEQQRAAAVTVYVRELSQVVQVPGALVELVGRAARTEDSSIGAVSEPTADPHLPTGEQSEQLQGTHVSPQIPSLVRMPFFVPQHVDAESIFAHLARHNVRPGRWYRPVLFPGATDNSVYSYVPGAPEHVATESLVAQVVNLPTDVSTQEASRIAGVVREALTQQG